MGDQTKMSVQHRTEYDGIRWLEGKEVAGREKGVKVEKDGGS